MKEEIARRDKTVEILLAFGNLYYQSQRYLDAIDWYRQAIEASEPGWRSWRALAASARAAGPSAAARARCARTGSRQYRELAREAAALERAGAAADAAWCWRAALGPALEARVRRAAAFLLAGNPDLARAELRSVLADEPRNPEALRLLRQAGSGADSAR
jgi:tetratricopeptide (TPR) repeat protein